ncbi:MAG: TetR/AcrR family transcriptional regulator [Clostridiales bacterium]|jgi:AcrR family transcriptional regulator|nr:TetR/AcrR family transcriptional regulator [Clostridiales bacterium]
MNKEKYTNKEKPNNRTIKSFETREKIYDAASKLFKKYGFDHVSVDTIVETAGVSKGSFYVHFDSKSSLIVALSADYVAQIDFDYKNYYESLPSDTLASEKLLLIVQKIADTITNVIGYDLIKSTYEAQISRHVKIDASLGYNRDLYLTINKVINLGIQQGEFKPDISIDAVVNHCVIAIRGLTYEWCIRYPDFDLKDQVAKYLEILLPGINSK